MLSLTIAGHAAGIREKGAKEYLFGMNPWKVFGVNLNKVEKYVAKVGIVICCGVICSFFISIIVLKYLIIYQYYI
jgi:hypothetical protein